MTMLQGQCACGDVRYQAEVDHGRRRYCGCSLCRLALGEAVVVGMELPAAAVHWREGDAVFYGAASQVRHGFCANCGSALCTVRQDGMVSLEVSTLDESAAIGVRSHIHATYRSEPASWPTAQ